MGFRIVTVFIVLTLPIISNAEIDTLHFRGEMKFVTLSGADCSDKERQNTSVPVDLALRVEKNDAGEHFDGFYSGLEIQTGHFTGINLSRLQLSYPDEIKSTPQGHIMELILNGATPGGNVREKHLGITDQGCNFDLAHLTLAPGDRGEKSVAIFTRLSKSFSSEVEFMLGYQLYDQGKIVESLPHLEAAVQLRKESEGFASRDKIYPALYLSLAYCVTGRFDECLKLQESVFSSPMENLKRQVLLHSTLVNLFTEQARRLGNEGQGEQAIVLIERASDKYPDLPELQQLLVEIYVLQGRAELACQRLEQAVRLHPDDIHLRKSLGWCLAQLGDELFDTDNPNKSLALLRRAIELNPEDKSIWDALLAEYTSIGSPGEALKLLQANETDSVRNLGRKEYDARLAYVYNEEARLAEKKMESRQAEKLYRQAVVLNPEKADYASGLARIIHKSGRYQESVDYLKEQRYRCKDDECRKTFDEYLQKEALIERMVQKSSSADVEKTPSPIYLPAP